jgi:TonB family protein
MGISHSLSEQEFMSGAAGLPKPNPIFHTFEELEYAGKPSAKLRFGSSVLIHFGVLASIILFYYFNIASLPSEDETPILTMVNLHPASMNLPGPTRGGGGGGGGKHEKKPPNKGDIPPAQKVQTVPPEVKKPDLRDLQMKVEVAQNIQAPIQFPKHMMGAYGDIMAPPAPPSNGQGSGGGIGSGSGSGIGSGRGPGVGPGSGGGFGGGNGGGVGNGEGPFVGGTGGVVDPVLIRQTLPHYTDEAIKAKIQGIVVLQAIIRRNGTVDQPRIIRSLGYGLDQEAIRVVVNEWRFKPGSLNGRPVDVYATIEITFTLR